LNGTNENKLQIKMILVFFISLLVSSWLVQTF